MASLKKGFQRGVRAVTAIGTKMLQKLKDDKMRSIIRTFLREVSLKDVTKDELRDFLVKRRSLLRLRYKTKYKKEYIGNIDMLFQEDDLSNEFAKA